MKRYLLIAIVTMIGTELFMVASDQLFHTSYTGETYFQPFPHLLFLLSCAASCYLGYRVRSDGHPIDEISFLNKAFNKLLKFLSKCFLLVAIGLVCMKLFGMNV